MPPFALSCPVGGGGVRCKVGGVGVVPSASRVRTSDGREVTRLSLWLGADVKPRRNPSRHHASSDLFSPFSPCTHFLPSQEYEHIVASSGRSAQPDPMKNCILLAACGATETLPVNPGPHVCVCVCVPCVLCACACVMCVCVRACVVCVFCVCVYVCVSE